MTTTAHEDQFSAAPEPVRQPYDTASILRRNIAALEVALRTQTERAEKAEAELANLAQQEPVAWMHDRDGRVDTCHDSVKELWIKVGQKQNTQFMREIVPCRVEHYNIPLYAAPAPAPHKGATHCDDCGLTWLDDGLNPLRCPYCKDSVPAPAVPAEWTEWNGGSVHPVLKDDQRNYEFLRRDGQLAAFVTSWKHGIEGTGARDIVAYRRKDCLLQSAEVQTSDKWKLTPCQTHPVDRNTGEVRHD